MFDNHCRYVSSPSAMNTMVPVSTASTFAFSTASAAPPVSGGGKGMGKKGGKKGGKKAKRGAANAPTLEVAEVEENLQEQECCYVCGISFPEVASFVRLAACFAYATVTHSPKLCLYMFVCLTCECARVSNPLARTRKKYSFDYSSETSNGQTDSFLFSCCAGYFFNERMCSFYRI